MSKNTSFFNTSLSSNKSSVSSHKIKSEIYDPFTSTKSEQALYKATQERYNERQVEKYQTPLYAKTNIINERELAHKSTVKKTQFSDTHSVIFDMGENRIQKEQQFKPSVIKVNEPGQNSHQVYKQQLKTSDLPSRQNLYRNPITDGDPKSEYVKVPTVRKENMPKNQLHLG